MYIYHVYIVEEVEETAVFILDTNNVYINDDDFYYIYARRRHYIK